MKKLIAIIIGLVVGAVLIFFVFNRAYYFFKYSNLPEVREVGLCLEGEKISPAKETELEEKIKKNPDDMDDRLRLLGDYFLRQRGPEAVQKARDAHVFWFIRNHPDSKVVGMPYAQIDSLSDPGYKEAKQLWLGQVQENPKNPSILKNAADFFELSDKSLAESLLEKGFVLEPSNYEWPNRLGHLYLLEHDFQKSFEEYEKAFQLAPNEQEKFNLLPNLSKTAVEAGQLKKARIYAHEMLEKVPRYGTGWNKLEDLHDANMVLGRVALRSGDLEKAKHYLLKAGQAPGNGPYSAFGPNMSLAKDLLEKGETETVLQYFDLCSRFWDEKATLAEWSMEARRGKVPNFRGNLYY